MESCETWRLFVALPVPVLVRSSLAAAIEELGRGFHPGTIRWVNPVHYHVTLRFLGEVSANQVAYLSGNLQSACFSQSRFRVRAAGLGCFAAHGIPRIIWGGVIDASKRLFSLREAVSKATSPFASQEVELQFAGHITVGRVKGLHSVAARELSARVAAAADVEFGSWEADHVELIRSRLSGGDPNYQTVSCASFANCPEP